MLFERLFFPRKRQQLIDKNDYLRREIKSFSLKDSCLSPKRDTAVELEALNRMEREIRFNNKLMNSFVAWYVLSYIGIRPKF